MSSIEKLFESIKQSENGLNISAFLQAYPDLARRSVQRWLAQLVDEDRIAPVGEGRGRRYLLIGDGTADGDAFPSYIPISVDSRDILAYINQPLSARKPVGYEREFLLAYKPNKTHYLSAALRRQLHRIGNTADMAAPAGTYSRAILNRLLIDLSWASSHLEGNTYSRLDTIELIEKGRAANGKAALETQMILNHKTAIELLVENAGEVNLNRYLLMNLHSSLSENLLSNPADEGRIRQHAVDIGLSVYRPLSAPQQIHELLDVVLDKVNKITDPFEQSFFVMVHLPYLQPFADINKRTSRLAANLPLFRANLCPLTFLDVSEQAYSRATIGVYEMTRVELLRDLYVWAYERSAQEYLAIKQNFADPDPLRLAYRELIKQAIQTVVKQPKKDPLVLVDALVAKDVAKEDRANVRALIVDELRRLHEGVLARYGLRPSEFQAWKAKQM